jgi:hypothetical protein
VGHGRLSPAEPLADGPTGANVTEPNPTLPASALWRDVHKGIRFGLTLAISSTSSLDPDDAENRTGLAEMVQELVDLLDSHADVEDRVTGPVIDDVLPDLGAQIRAAHEFLGPRAAALRVSADRLLTAADPHAAMRSLHLDLAAFAGEYFIHQDHEERVVLPALEAAVGLERVRELEIEFVAAVSPHDRMLGLEFMVPAMNVVERAEVITAIRANAPADVVAEVWELVTDVLDPEDVAALEARLDRPRG